MVNGKIIQFRRGRHLIKEKHMLIEIEGSDSKEKAEKFVGKSVEWKSPSGKIFRGKIAGFHGNNGLVRAIFEKGLQGQSIGNEVKIE